MRVLVLKPSSILGAGVGCFSLTPIAKGEQLSECAELFVKLEDWQIPHEYLKYCPRLPSGQYLCPPDFLKMGVFWYLNHAKHPNLVFENKRLYTCRPVQRGEELTVYYSDLLTHPENKLWVRECDI